jgi:NAD(P)-dependent dehydrogenase (short-subunit alcohol dehydrogenase family)
LAGQFDNHLWRLICCSLGHVVAASTYLSSSSTSLALSSLVWIVIYVAILFCPHLRRPIPRKGCVFITGADSGMGQATVVYLAQTQTSTNRYDKIFAGCFNAQASKQALEELVGKDLMKDIHVVSLDVTKDESVEAAAKTVEDAIMANNKKSIGLTSLVNFHGIAFNGPIQYMPIEMFQRQLDVNFMGNIRMVQSFLPLLRKATSVQVPGRLVFTGTGGGPCTPCPPLLSAYMSSKFAGEAFCQSLRMELFMTNQAHIECCVINPGFVKPTQLMAQGILLTNKMWKACEDRMHTSVAKDEFGPLMDHFLEYSDLQPGTHVRVVCKAAEHALTAYKPRSSYKVGIDSKLAPIVGMLPTGVREWIARNGIYGVLSPAGTVKGYQV